MKTGIFALMIVSLVLVGGAALAYGGFGKSDAIRNALENNDFQAWKDAKIADFNARMDAITQEDFDKIKERWDSNADRRAERMEKMQPMIDAIEANDYDAWVIAVEDTRHGEKLLEVVNANNFDTFVEMHDAKVAGDYVTVKEKANELGLEKGFFGKGHKHGHKFKGEIRGVIE